MLQWLNILGMVLQFLSFWCAAPELMGDATMQRLETTMTRFVARIPVILVFGGMMTYTLVVAGFGIYEGVSAGHGGTAVMDMGNYALMLGAACAAYLLFMLLHERILRYLEERLAQPLVRHMVTNADARRNGLLLGAILLTTGFLMQLVVAVVA